MRRIEKKVPCRVGLKALAHGVETQCCVERPSTAISQPRPVRKEQCHALDVAADQQLDPAGWKSLVDQMAGKGAVATDAEFDEIVHYLANAFPASK